MSIPSHVINLPTNCDFSQYSIAEAVVMLGPARIYYLHVAPKSEWDAKRLLKGMGADSVGNPVSPYINLILDSSLEYGNWFVTVSDKAVGAEGI